jgi:DNA modification methylase
MLNRCHIGDCRELLKQFAAAGVRAQMCVTSPPYFGLRDYGADGQIGLEDAPDHYIAEIVNVFRGVRGVLSDDGTAWLNLGDSYGAGKQLMGIPWRVALALQLDGWYLRSDIIWHKPNPMPESVTDRPTKAHEYLFLLAKSERYYYDGDAIKEEQQKEEGSISVRSFVYQHENADPKGGGVRGEGGLAGRVNTGFRNKRTVWSVATQPFDGAHFATFPRTLIEPCILAGSRPGDVVLDPFMGSGTTAQVSEHLGRQWIGCEINADYMVIQAMRLAQRAMAF